MRAGLRAGRAQFRRRRQWWKRAAHTAAGTYLGTMLAFVATVAAARGLGPHDFGVVTLAVAVTTLIATILDVTLEEAVVHHGYRARERKDTAALRGLVRTAFLLDLVVGAVVCGAIVALAGPIADLASAGRLDPTLVVLAAGIPLVSTANPTTGAVLLVAGRPDLRGWVTTATNAARLVAVLFALQIGTPAAVIVAYVAGEAVGALVLASQAWRVGWRVWSAETHERVLPVRRRELMRFGALTSVTTTVYAAWSALIPVVLGRVAGPTTVGIFRVAMFPVFISTNLTGPFRLVMLPEQARMAAQGNVARLRKLVRTQTLAGLAFATPLATVLYFALPWLIPALYSDRYADAVPAARILLVGVFGTFAFIWFKSFAGAIGRPGLRTAIAIQDIVLLGSLLALLGADGPVGAATAWAGMVMISSVVSLLAVSWQLNRLERDNERDAERDAERPAPRELAPAP